VHNEKRTKVIILIFVRAFTPRHFFCSAGDEGRWDSDKEVVAQA